jgi:mercuric ion transport protein
MRIQLITFPECPHTPAARAALRRVLASTGVTYAIEEVNTSALGEHDPLRNWGSPTVLLNGEDVGGQRVPTGPNCRLYRNDEGNLQGVPPESLITAAVQRALTRTPRD